MQHRRCTCLPVYLSAPERTGEGYSVLQIIKAIEKVTGLTVTYEAVGKRKGDLTQLYANAERARNILNFTPVHSSLENIIATAWEFHRRKWGL